MITRKEPFENALLLSDQLCLTHGEDPVILYIFVMWNNTIQGGENQSERSSHHIYICTAAVCK